MFLFRTPNERDVRTFEETSTRTNTHNINWNYAVVAENATLHGVNFVVEAMSKEKTLFACGVTSRFKLPSGKEVEVKGKHVASVADTSKIG